MSFAAASTRGSLSWKWSESPVTFAMQTPSAACRGTETVFHVAAVPGIWGLWEHFYGVNTVGTQNVIDACLSQGVRKLVYTSTPSVVY